MKATRVCAGIALALVVSCQARAEALPSETSITVPVVEVRSGPSLKFYPTSILRQGARVTLVTEKDRQEVPGWLAIKPPPGSFSWINARFLETSGQIGQVFADDVPVRIGSELVGDPPIQVERVKLKRGTQVLLGNQKIYDKDGGWLQIAATAQEVRYIPAEAVKGSPLVQTISSAPPAVAPLPAGGESDPLWIQAAQAERAGDVREAIRLYEELGRMKAISDHELSVKCYNKSHFLRTGQGSVMPGNQQQPASAYYGNPGNRLVPTPTYPNYTPQPGWATSAPPQPPYRPTSQYTWGKENGPSYSTTQYPQAPYYGKPATNVPQSQWSGPGYLRRAPFILEGKQAYALNDSQGTTLMYLTAEPGLNLDSYSYRNVNAYGALYYNGHLKANHMRAVSVTPLQ